MTKRKIYFAGSIRGGRTDAALYQRMIKLMQNSDTVLTEHVGYLSLSTLEQGRGGDSRIYEQDTAWLREAELLVAECTTPSLGVGYELAYAEKLGIPCHLFYDKSKCQLSAMLTGNAFFHIHPYQTEAELFDQLSKVLAHK